MLLNDAEVSYYDPNMMGIGYLDEGALNNSSLPKLATFGLEDPSSMNWGG
jgi:hypothetical protein